MDQPLINQSPFSQSPVVPTMLGSDASLTFRCHKEIACFNACCKNIDITLTPYDVLRLKKRLDITSNEFLALFTEPYEIDQGDIAGVKLKPVEGGTACQFMTEEGCSVYEDRPTACRYYPVAHISMRRQNEYTDTDHYALVKEAHCLGHEENRTLTIEEYRKEQGVDLYDEMARGWRQLILKKKSAGPAVGKPSKRSLRLFFMVSYDLEGFRHFVTSEGFNEAYVLDDALKAELASDDVALMQFGFRFLKQILFGEVSIEERPDAVEKRLQRMREAQAAPEGE